MKLHILGLALSLSFASQASDDFDLTDMLPATPNTTIEGAENVTVKGDVVVASSDPKVAVAVAHQALLEDDEDGVKMIQVGSGTGILSIGSASYTGYNNMNATLLSKRGAYNQAYLVAKKQLIENMKGVEHQCNNVASLSLENIETGNEGVANTQNKMTEACKEAVSGSLAGFVTFDVNDDVENKTVRVSLISTPKTRSQISKNSGALVVNTDPNSIFKQVIKDIKSGVLPPVGAKVLSDARTGETIILGYGSAIIRNNKSSSVARKLKQVAKRQSQTRARSALLATMKGEKVYWQGSFDENQMEGTTQFEYDDPDFNDPQQVKVLDEERSEFLNQLKTSDEYATIAQGKLPAGVNTKSFKSADGHWQYTVAVYAPSLEAAAKKANAEMVSKIQGHGTVSSTGRKIKAVGGKNEKAENPKGASGQVTKKGDL
ncbi:hypothetical protein D5R81_04755 [Parashewanella spongiae]|uniref:SPOR domain-containing protein n=1 Tax=Parashewanella spongiae TaxID=342950 RepID=A0A3A6UAG5_9GAMM|nr:hypothetical protein [Parashewanella spongiae]MCL1077293.1 hypothetical protein [Parashewanella spongiae]RJY18529.1 hypothetical protein D5R81_04755 [Parashewanella spongiae]